MQLKFLSPFLFCLFMSSLLFGQDTVRGRVNSFTYDTVMPVPNATVTNLTSKQSVLADVNGYYIIKANENDTLVFSHVNYKADTIPVLEQAFISGYDAALIKQSEYLNNVTVQADYSSDSLKRREYYSTIYEKPAGITGGNTPSAGVGVVLSPASFFSKNAKAKRRLKKRLDKQEEDKYIDYVFSAGRVSALTGLKGDSLTAYFLRYRPDYTLARQLGYDGALIYINDKYKEFKGEIVNSSDNGKQKR